MTMILEKIQVNGFRVVVRDVATGEARTLKLSGSGPWDLVAPAPDEVESATGARTEPPAQPPPDDAITLRLVCKRDASVVHVHAVGSGAVAWMEHKKTLLGATWGRDLQGAPLVVLPKSPTLADDVRAALPAVKIDTSECEDPDLQYSGQPPSAETEARRATGRTLRRGERLREDQLGQAQLDALGRGERLELHADVPAPQTPAPSDASPAPAEAKKERRRRRHEAVEPGPGELQWSAITENDVDGFAAPWRGGNYKLMHVAGDAYALYFEHSMGGYELILCGNLDEAKAAASEHIDGMSPVQAARATCGPTAKPPGCRSPRSMRVLNVPDLLDRYDTRSVRAAFNGAVREGFSLCADHAGLQDHEDLTVDRAMELLEERGQDALYALADVRTLAVKQTPEAAPQPRAEAAPKRAKPEKPAAPPPDKPAAVDAESAMDKELLSLFAGELDAVLDEEAD